MSEQVDVLSAGFGVEISSIVRKLAFGYHVGMAIIANRVVSVSLLGLGTLVLSETSARPDELAALKAHTVALQSRIHVLETALVPVLSDRSNNQSIDPGQTVPGREDGDTTFGGSRESHLSAAPSAALASPYDVITFYGRLRGDATWTSESGSGDLFDMASLNGSNEADEWRQTANRSRFGMKTKVGTTLGEIRTQMEMDFPRGLVRLRRAFGEWDLTPNWTLTAGQTWQTMDLPIGTDTVDIGGPAGFGSLRRPQIKAAYSNGSTTWAFGVEDPTLADADYPDLALYVQQNTISGHELYAGVHAADWGGSLGWAAGVGGNFVLSSVLKITVGAVYGEGYVGRVLAQHSFDDFDAFGNPYESWGISAGVELAVSESIRTNIMWGYSDTLETATTTANGSNLLDNVTTVHANIMWRPVKQMRLGWEVMWGRNENFTGTSNDAVRSQFAAWFYF